MRFTSCPYRRIKSDVLFAIPTLHLVMESFMKKRTKKKKNLLIPDNKYRIIKISKEALFEFIYESVNDKQDILFDVEAEKNGGFNISIHFDMNWDTGEFIAIAGNDSEGGTLFSQFDEIDSKLLIENMKDTTGSLYNENPYIELSLDEIKKIQENT